MIVFFESLLEILFELDWEGFIFVEMIFESEVLVIIDDNVEECFINGDFEEF